MRQGIGCVLVERRHGSLDEVRRVLETWRIGCRAIPPEALTVDAAPPGDPVLLEVAADSPRSLAGRLAARRAAGGAALAIGRKDDAGALALAAALGVDDILEVPLDQAELVRRLQTLAVLAHLAAERGLRERLSAAYLSTDGPVPAVGETAPARVVMLGAAATAAVAVLNALPPSRISYLDEVADLAAIGESETPALVVVTAPDQILPALAALDRLAGDPPVLLAAHAGRPTALELPAAVELLPLPAPIPIATARLRLALRLAALRAALRRPPRPAAGSLMLDALTGLYNQGAFLDYLHATAGERVLLGLEIAGFDVLNDRSGYPAGNRALARLGRRLAHRIRATDLAGHLGGGRFAVAVAPGSRTELEGLRTRLETVLADGESWDVVAAAESLPVRGAPAQRLARLFGDLGRLRRAA